MPLVLARPAVSGHSAYSWAFRRFYTTHLSVAYRLVPLRLQYGCSTFPSETNVYQDDHTTGYCPTKELFTAMQRQTPGRRHRA